MRSTLILSLLTAGACGPSDCGKGDTGEPPAHTAETGAETGEETGTETDTDTSRDDTGTGIFNCEEAEDLRLDCPEAAYGLDVMAADAVLQDGTVDGIGGSGLYASDLTGDGLRDLVLPFMTISIIDPTGVHEGENELVETRWGAFRYPYDQGFSEALGCDFNGDGFDDVAVTGLTWPDDYHTGYTYQLAYGPVTPAGDDILWDASFAEEKLPDYKNLDVRCVGDLNGTGQDVLWAWYKDGDDYHQWLHEGPVETFSDLEESGAWIEESFSLPRSTDFNGDGVLDLIHNTEITPGGGITLIYVTYIFPGPVDGGLGASEAGYILESPPMGLEYPSGGYVTYGIPDWNLDGYGDIMAVNDDPAHGAAFIPGNSESGCILDLATYHVIPTELDEWWGAQAKPVEDATLDGRPEVLLSSQASERAWLLDAPGEGVVCLDEAAILSYGSSNAEADKFGAFATGEFDFDVDGRADLTLAGWEPAQVYLLSAAGL